MIKVNILVDDVEDRLDSNFDIGQASLADLTICERMLRRYLNQVADAADEILDKDTKKEKKKKYDLES